MKDHESNSLEAYQVPTQSIKLHECTTAALDSPFWKQRDRTVTLTQCPEWDWAHLCSIILDDLT